MAYVLITYDDEVAAQRVIKVLNFVENHNTDLIRCTYRIKPTAMH